MSYIIPNQLKTAIKEKRLILFIGAGLSSNAGLPLWKDIVSLTLDHPNIEKGEGYKAALNQGLFTPLEILDKIKNHNKREIYTTFEKETSLKKESDIHKNLSKISRKIITTNYDCLIEDNTNIEKIDTNSVYKLQKLDDADEFVLKIHGCTSAIDNAVIFTADYKNLYEENGLAKFQLTKILSTHHCLFIGYSLSDHYLVELFDSLNDIYEGLGKEHYIISTENISHNFIDTIKISSYDDIEKIVDILTEYSNPETSDTPSSIEVSTSENIEKDEHGEESYQITISHDKPPIIEHWAGRIAEMDALKLLHKACFITGIGGQGKSALASKYLTEIAPNDFDILEWCDFKEEELNFQTKLYQLIEVVSNNTVKTNELIGLETDTLVDIFFKELNEQKGFFVFDNIDKYIDLQRFIPSGEMKKFFDCVINTNHNSRFIFTCRPFIHLAMVGTYQIRLEGLREHEIQDLITKYHHNIKDNDLRNLAERLYRNTQGHPLWMGLILAQSRVKFENIDKVLKKIERRDISQDDSNFSTIVSATVLENLWDGLKEKEKIILRTLSICNIAESHDELSKIVSKKLNYNQFSKVIRSLKSLNLLVEKGSNGYLELHPLVREFIKGKYDEREQESYIALYVNYLNGIIVLIKNKFGKVLPQDEIEFLLKKIEILISANKIQESIDEIRLTADSLLISGYCEEYLRLTNQLLEKIKWTHKNITGLLGFPDFIDSFFTRSSEFGRYDLFDNYTEKYSSVFQIADANLILLKSAQCHRYWIEGDIKRALHYGKSAADLIDMLGEKDIWSGKHRYNLSLRDSGIDENIDRASQYFCEGKSLDELTDDSIDINFATHYGNIGRCYFLKNEMAMALKLICKSYASFKKGGLSYHNTHNIGYAAKWISEISSKSDVTNLNSIYFLVYAKNIWKNDMPGEANKIELTISSIPHTTAIQSVLSLESWQIEKYCNEWVENILQ
ncbi:SIR2 family protein [Klebsiella aerogenes]|uniref:SIR2 family protein n=1 Tax=Klebsiella aerogenes TaxID=548 RepID=UPI003A813B8E